MRRIENHVTMEFLSERSTQILQCSTLIHNNAERSTQCSSNRKKLPDVEMKLRVKKPSLGLLNYRRKRTVIPKKDSVSRGGSRGINPRLLETFTLRNCSINSSFTNRASVSSYQDNFLTVKGKRTDMKLKLFIGNPESFLEKDVYLRTLELSNQIPKIYGEMYHEIDREKLGYFTLTEVKYYVTIKLFGIYPNHRSFYSSSQYSNIVSYSKGIFSVLNIKGNSENISKKEFLAVCSVYEYNSRGEDQFEVLDKEKLARVTYQLQELKQIFLCYAVNGEIHKDLLESLLRVFKAPEDAWKCYALISEKRLKFEHFLNYLPFMLYVHTSICHKHS